MNRVQDWRDSTPTGTQDAVLAVFQTGGTWLQREAVNRWSAQVIHDAPAECFQVLAEHIGQAPHCRRYDHHYGRNPPRR